MRQGPDPRRRRRPACRIAHLRRMGGRRARRAEHARAVRARRLRARLLRAQRRRGRPLQADGLLRRPARPGDRPRRPGDRHRVAAAGRRADRLRAGRRGAGAGGRRRGAAVSVASLVKMRERLRQQTNGYTVTAAQYVLTARIALVALTLIVLTGAAVRLTGSGLGCPTWPKCYGSYYPPLNTHAVIEFSNRVVTVPVVLAAGAAWLFALRRRPYRRDLVWLGALLPLGVVGQAVLGGFTVK